MLLRNLYLALVFSVPILVECQQPVQWSSTQWNSCIKGNDDKIFGEVKTFKVCKHVCLLNKGCKAVVYHANQGKCITTDVNTNTARLLKPCPELGWRYAEISENNSGIRSGGQGGGTNAQPNGCNVDLQCENDKRCKKGRCVNPCELITCAPEASCQVSERIPQCICPVNTQGDPRRQCLPKQENNSGIRSGGQGGGSNARPKRCTRHLDCGNNGLCALGVCVQKTVEKGADPCKSAGCGRGAQCQVNQGRPECFCPSNTQGDPRVQCHHKQECSDNSHCGFDKRCKSGKCVDACQLAKCGQGATCHIIYGRPQCRCPARMIGDPQKQCFTTQDTLDCQFPFIHKGTQYSACTSEGDPDEKFWCSTKTNNLKNHLKGNWRHCTGCELAQCEPGASCQVINANTQSGPHVQCKSNRGPSVCQFPFIYKGTTFIACTRESDQEGKLWCSTKTDSQKNHQKGNWKHCTDNSGIGDRYINSSPASNSPVGNGQTKPAQGPTRQPGCSSLPDPGECRGAFPRFYYNQQRDQCDCFLFGGCDEERVKFTWLSFEECLGTCVPGNKAKGPGCQRVTLEEVQRFVGR